MNFKIAICDDEERYRSHLYKMILKDSFVNHYEADITEYASGSALVESLDIGESYDVYFLDIQMENGTDDGIRVAREIRNRGEKGLIVYVTSFIDYVQIGYEVKAFRYLLKSQIEEKLPEVLEDIRTELSGEDFFLYQARGENVRVEMAQITYLESDKRQIKIVLQNGEEQRFYESMDNVCRALGDSFVRCHRSYTVNLLYIKSWSVEQIELKGGVIIPISRSYAKSVKQTFMSKLL